MMEAGNEFGAYGEAERAAGQKSPDAFRTISEVSTDLDVPQHVLRFWEGKFTQIRPLKRGGGRRYYRPDDLDLLRGIQHLLYGDGYTIKGVQKLLREHGVKFVIAAGRRTPAQPKAKGTATPVTEVPFTSVIETPEADEPLAMAADDVVEPEIMDAAPAAAAPALSAPPPTAPASESDRFEMAARLFGKLKALRRDYDQKLQAAKNGR